MAPLSVCVETGRVFGSGAAARAAAPPGGQASQYNDNTMTAYTCLWWLVLFQDILIVVFGVWNEERENCSNYTIISIIFNQLSSMCIGQSDLC